MIRFMIDTDDLTALTGHVELLATYADLVTDLRQLQHEFPHSQVILIDRGMGDHTGLASVFDIEPGALTVSQAVKRYDEQRSKGVQFLTCYHDRKDAAEVAAAFSGRPHYNWDATLDGTAHIKGYDPLNSPAVIQCLTAGDLGYHADGNLVFEDGWHPSAPHVNTQVLGQDLRMCQSNTTATLANLNRMAALLRG